MLELNLLREARLITSRFTCANNGNDPYVHEIQTVYKVVQDSPDDPAERKRSAWCVACEA